MLAFPRGGQIWISMLFSTASNRVCINGAKVIGSAMAKAFDMATLFRLCYLCSSWGCWTR
jgi:hypothetical protein